MSNWIGVTASPSEVRHLQDEARRLKNELDAAVDHASDLIRQRNDLREQNRKLLEAVSLVNENVYGIGAWVFEEGYVPVNNHQIVSVLAAVRWKAGL